jgi:hypothetical protein
MRVKIIIIILQLKFILLKWWKNSLKSHYGNSTRVEGNTAIMYKKQKHFEEM